MCSYGNRPRPYRNVVKFATRLPRTPQASALQRVKQALLEADTTLDEDTIVEINKFMNIKALSRLDEPGQDDDSLKHDWMYQVLTNLKMGKAPGPDGIPNEFYYLLRNNSLFVQILKEVMIGIVHYQLQTKQPMQCQLTSEGICRWVFRSRGKHMCALGGLTLGDFRWSLGGLCQC